MPIENRFLCFCLEERIRNQTLAYSWTTDGFFSDENKMATLAVHYEPLYILFYVLFYFTNHTRNQTSRTIVGRYMTSCPKVVHAVPPVDRKIQLLTTNTTY